MSAQSAALASWAFLPVPAFGLLATALVYFRGWNKLRRQVPSRYPLSRLACFLAGLAAIYLSLASPLDAFASFLLTAHMVQHLLLTMVAPPLLLLGAPQLPLLCGLPRHLVSRVLGPFLLWPLLKSFLHRLMHPIVCWVLFVLSNVLWHLPTSTNSPCVRPVGTSSSTSAFSRQLSSSGGTSFSRGRAIPTGRAGQ